MIDITGIKDRFDLATVIEANTGQEVRYGRNIHCPWHSDSDPSLTVWPDGRWKCWGKCGRHGDLLDFLGYMFYGDSYNPHVHLREIVDRLNGPGFAATIRHVPQQAQPQPQLRPTLEPVIVDKLEALFGERELAYWKKQHIPPSVLYGLRVGWTGQRYTFPWFYRGILTAIKMRRDDDLSPNMKPKYISRKGSRYTAPYNIDAVLDGSPDTVLIVEDEKSVMAALRYRLTAVAAPANAWKADWCNLLSDVEHILIVADNDDPGIASAKKINGMIRRARIVLPVDGKDLFDQHLYFAGILQDKDGETAAMRCWLGLDGAA